MRAPSRHRAPAGPRRWLFVGLVVLLVADLATGAGLWLNRHEESATGRRNIAATHGRAAGDVASLAERARVHAVESLLARRAAAIRDGDRQGFLAVIDPRSRRFRARQAAYFDNVRGVPIRTWDYRLVPKYTAQTGRSWARRYGGRVWAPRVVLRYSLRGPDHSVASVARFDTFVRLHGRWYLGSDSDFSRLTPRDIWDSGPVVVVRRGRALVLGHPDSPLSLTAIADEAARDVPRVRGIWGARGWSSSVIIVVPDSQRELDRMLCRAGDLDQIAAVTAPEIGCASTFVGAVSDRVILNPPNFAKLAPIGRQVVLTHEITHVATRSVTGPLMPTWVIEGMADYVGYHDIGLGPQVAARELAVDLVTGYSIGDLPTDHAYAGSNPRLPQTYERSWLACRYLATTYGDAKLVRFYRVLGTTDKGTERSATAAALRKVYGLSVAELTQRWRTYVRSVLR